VLAGGPLGRVRDGDLIRLDAEAGVLQALVAQEEWERRSLAHADRSSNMIGMGRELFAMFRSSVSIAEEGAASFGLPHLATPSSPEINQPHEDAEPFSDEDTHVQQSI